MSFEDVVGQKETIDRLKDMKSEGRVPHAILLCGPSGCGKIAIAMGFATRHSPTTSTILTFTSLTPPSNCRPWARNTSP